MSERARLRPFFPYYGSKWNIAKLYQPPKHEITIEPFAGAASYSSFYGVETAFLIEKDSILASLWRYLLTTTGDQIMALPNLPNAGDNVDDHHLEPGARALIGFWLNRGSATPKRTRTTYSARSDRGQLNWGPRAKERIASQLEHITGWRVLCGDFTEAPEIAATWFIDPPYVDKGKFYRTRFDRHDELGEWSQTRRGQVIVCEGVGAEWLPFQRLGEFKSSTGRALEVVWQS